ncbi:hypothetical protein DSL72_008567 [Monilinia vaccinii-corymbosi]|uniref:DUF7918 domain-containing protein n=1 Tax=Monilinia vaccinii-corymbosi TaxID=61207 RepID=A0A8A3PRG2_9HELO|nr:hypothetical protein DSL72_008567 [Monilinia vaccinii-corymbosi]
MAILDKLPGLEGSVEVGGVQVREYEDEEEIDVKPGPVGEHQAARTVSKYIEADDGAEFIIKCSLLPQFKMDSPNIQADVSVDSNYAEGRIFEPVKQGTPVRFQGPKTFNPSSIAAERWLLQKYRANEEARFSSLNQNKVDAEKVGMIEVRVWRVSELTPMEPRTSRRSTAPNKFHEKALKGQAKTHHVSYSAATPTTASNIVSATMLDGIDYPIAIYKFKYRSKEALKQLLIIERTPEPEDSPTPGPAPDFDLHDLTPAQKERLQTFLRNEGIADGRTSNTPERKIKREREIGRGSSNQAGLKKSRTTEVIDLTADSDEE